MVIFLFVFVIVSHAKIPAINQRLENASVMTQDDEIIVSTGIVSGRWIWTGEGFVTIGFKNDKDDKEIYEGDILNI